MIITNLRKKFLNDFYRREVKEYVRELQEYQWHDEETQYRRQMNRLIGILDHAKYVPFYKQFLSETDFYTDPILVLKRLPILEKEFIQDNQDILIHPEIKPEGIGTTSGSTGIGLKFYFDENMLINTETLTRFFRSWYGIEPGDRTLKIWGRPIEGRKIISRSHLSDVLRGVKTVDPWKLDPDNLQKNWNQIIKFNPDYIYAYATSIAALAKWVAEFGLEISAKKMRLKAIISTAETLLPSDKQKIKDVFDCPVVEEYGAAEVSIMAHECPVGNFHIASESVYLECVDDHGNDIPAGRPGHILVTSFMNRAQPLIRYRIGDYGTLLSSTCSCGRKLPLMKLTGAKIIELIKTKSGKVFSAEILDYINLALLRDPKFGINQFRIIQKDLSTFFVEVVPNQHFNQQTEENFVKLFTEQLGEKDLSVIFETKQRINPLPSGKLLYFKSEIL